MSADCVEREILIAASPKVVWDVITQPAQIRRWFSDEAAVEARAGADGSLTWKPGGRGGSANGMVVPIRVVAAEPFRRFAFRWNHPDGAQPDRTNSALVEFSLTEEADGTLLRVIESGIDAVTQPDGRARYVEEHGGGWDRHLGELRELVGATERGAAR